VPVIPFPIRQKPLELEQQERLARALTSLNAALAKQKVIIAAWREKLESLEMVALTLHESLHCHLSTMQWLEGDLLFLRDKIQLLEELTDGTDGHGVDC
jgi:hypothetical protein